MSGGGAGRGHSEGSAGGETGRSVGERPAEAAARQRTHPEPDRAEEGRGGQVDRNTVYRHLQVMYKNFSCFYSSDKL